jgi:saccharopine dehydrogenase-like NADP-dependent oxidoreductase
VGIPSATAYLTGVAGSIFAQLLADGKIEQKGVIAPEEAVSPDDFASGLSERGLRIRKRSRTG